MCSMPFRLGTSLRQGTNSFLPMQVPDLIGVKDRRYLDHTGLDRHRDIGDFMRYAAKNQGADQLASYAGFVPADVPRFTQRPAPETRLRYSDEQLYALARYVYSLQPPPNPNAFDALAERGQQIFEREGCAMCHTPPLYTNNKLTPAEGFQIPPEHLEEVRHLAYLGGHRTRPWRCGLGVARGITRCRHSKALVSRTCFRTTARARHSKTGSIRPDCATTTCRPASKDMASRGGLYRVTSSGYVFRWRTNERSSHF